MTDLASVLDSAESSLARGNYEAAVRGATLLVDAGEPWLIDGLFRRALAREHWADGPPNRLDDAAADWRELVRIAPCNLTYRGLARVQLKLGDRDSGLVSLLEAQRGGTTPEVLLGFAQFHGGASPPDLVRAKAYFFGAAIRGRTPGIRGYVEVAYELDQPCRAAAMVLLALVAMPLLALILGERRHVGF